MGKPAARLTDMHVCPMVTGIVPHVGGPISGPGCPTVIIGGLPAARVTDLGVCVGPPDLIALGSTGVFIGGLPAARMGDLTAHGGTIVFGFPTVLIGEVGGGGGGGGGGSGGGPASARKVGPPLKKVAKRRQRKRKAARRAPRTPGRGSGRAVSKALNALKGQRLTGFGPIPEPQTLSLTRSLSIDLGHRTSLTFSDTKKMTRQLGGSGSLQADSHGVAASGSAGANLSVSDTKTIALSSNDKLGHRTDSTASITGEITEQLGGAGSFQADRHGVVASGSAGAYVSGSVTETATAKSHGVSMSASSTQVAEAGAKANVNLQVNDHGVALGIDTFTGADVSETVSQTVSAGGVSSTNSVGISSPGSVGLVAGVSVTWSNGVLQIGGTGGFKSGAVGVQLSTSNTIDINKVRQEAVDFGTAGFGLGVAVIKKSNDLIDETIGMGGNFLFKLGWY